MIQGSIKILITACTLFVVPWLCCVTTTSAMEKLNPEEHKAFLDLKEPKEFDYFDSNTYFDSEEIKNRFDFGESEALSDIDYHKVWYGPRKPKELQARDHLEAYLKRPLDDRKKSEPFFTCPSHLDDKLPGVVSLRLMNNMLQSDKIYWAGYIVDIINTNPSENIKNFWAFIFAIADFMPTPCLQTTFFAVSKEKKKVEFGDEYRIKGMFERILDRYAKRMKEHVVLLDQRVGCMNKEEVVDIFTRDAQEKLGEYGIHLEKQWSAGEDVVVYKSWASHMLVYGKVKGSLAVFLETQAIQASLITADKGYSRAQCLENWQGKRFQDLAKEGIDIMQSLKTVPLEEFERLQLKYSYGIFSGLAYEVEEVKKVLGFWLKYMPFYLDIKLYPGRWKTNDYLSILIMDETKDNDLGKVMEKFLPFTATSQPKNIAAEFFIFLEENSESPKIREMATTALKIIEEDHGKDYLSNIRNIFKEGVEAKVKEGVKKRVKEEVKAEIEGGVKKRPKEEVKEGIKMQGKKEV